MFFVAEGGEAQYNPQKQVDCGSDYERLLQNSVLNQRK